MPYLTHVHVHRCRNVRDLHIDLSLPAGERGFRHLILTGPNGSGKSGILEGIEEELIEALFSPDASRRMLQQNRERRRGTAQAKPSLAQLTKKQLEVALLLTETDLSYRQIAASLQIEEGTLRKHAENIYTRLGVHGRQELTIGRSTNPDHAGSEIELAWDADPASISGNLGKLGMIAIYLPAKRHVERQDVRGPVALEWEPEDLDPEHELAQSLLQFLVNKEAERAFALARGDEPSAGRAATWLARFADHLRRLTNDPDLRVEFDQQAYNFRFHARSGYVFDLNSLADGHSAALSILTEILLRVDAVQRARGDYTFEPEGIVVIDEIETHLHLKLQEQILPFFTELFPRLQFLIATHSPAVIASIPGAIVCDLERGEQTLSDHYRGIPYGVLMKDHFGIASDIDLDSTRGLLRLRELAAIGGRSPEQERELQALAAELSGRSPVLATEVWMVMEGLGHLRQEARA